MARKTRTWYNLLVKLVTFVTAALGIAVTIICTWKLVKVIQDEDQISHLQIEWNDDSETKPKIDGTFKTIMMVCLSVTIFSGILQVVSSLGVLFSCSEDVQTKVKKWLLIHFIILLLMILCFLLRLSYNTYKSRHAYIDEFFRNVKSEFSYLKNIKTIESSEEIELHAFSYTLLSNSVSIFVFMIVLSVFYQCSEDPYEAVR